MHRPIAFSYLALLLAAPVFSSDDVNYDPDTNYRPENVTGLDYYYYPWVGSYYNGTATFTISSLSVRSRSRSSSSSSSDDDEDSDLCPQLQNYTYTLSYPALLGITETEPDDERPENTNPVNVILSTSYSNFTRYFNDFMDSSNMQIRDMPWVFESVDVSRRTFGYESTDPNFNLSISDNSGSDTPYRLSGSSSDESNPLPTLQTNMSSCSRLEDWWGVSFSSELTFPALQVTFDARSANFALVSGAVMNTLRREDDDEEETPQLAGRISVEFLGSIDEARSDVLDSPGGEGEPRWIRSVGFGNYSANLDYGSENAGSAVAVGGIGGVLGWAVGLMGVVGCVLW
ncbi:uncharacterized protein DSM5745_08725 [Aspergillus mulundensis]|uniref:Uncharacterized protein n=1 Tax=Aspergillus mulundensis TaxID=1810919 RepID=A0A3D8R4I7_9EURO|nr:Uncharacterized protein DSM5745_08725 [Aspergillus mulundensis]RDW68965.1 Uncharacterized protein DSM5745_08725 [Aspergillus mulundensis]